ncbi:MAG: hypothetical protein WDN48_00755 [Pseudolabrys sp.]
MLGAQEEYQGGFPAAGDDHFSVSSTDPGFLKFGLKDGATLNERNDTIATADKLWFSEIGQVSQLQTVRVGGKVTAGDVVELTLANAMVAGAHVNYLIEAGDTADTIGAKLVAAINADNSLHTAGITASDSHNGVIQIYKVTKVDTALTGVDSHAATENIHVATGYGNLLDVSSNVAVQVSLPIEFLGISVGTVSIEIGNLLGGSKGWALDANPWTLSLPDISNIGDALASNFNLFSFLNSPEAVINGLNAALGALQTIFTQQVFGYQLPLVGPALGKAGDFIGSMRATLIGDLNGLVNDYKTAHNGAEPTTADIVQEGVDAMTSALGFTGGFVDSNGVHHAALITVDAANKTIDFVLDMSRDLFNGTVNLSSNFGIPGLGISVQNGAVNLDLSTNIHLEFNYVQGKGFSMLDSAAGQHAVALAFALTIPQNFSVGLTLGILNLTGTNGSYQFTNADGSTATGTSLRGGVFLDLHPKGSNDLADLGATTTLIEAVDDGTNQIATLTLPSILSVTSAYNFQVVINGTAVTVSVAADEHRTTEAELVDAINAALGQATIKTSIVDPHAAANATETLSALGVHASLDTSSSTHTVSFKVADSALGAHGTLALQDVPIAFSKIGSNLRAEVSANLDLDFKLRAALFGGSQALPSVSTELLFAYQFDKVLFGTNVNAVSGVIMPFTFQDVTLDVGSFLSQFLNPILQEAYSIIKPVLPVLNFVVSPLPGISTLLGHPVSLLDLGAITSPSMKPAIQQVKNYIAMAQQIAALVKSIVDLANANGGEVKIDFGTFHFGKATVGPLAQQPGGGGAGNSGGSGDFDPFAGGKLQNYNIDANQISSVSPSTVGSNPKASAALGQMNSLKTKGGWSFPILQDPLSVVQLLMARPRSR